MADSDTDVSALNRLIEATIDSADGYETAASVADVAGMGAKFHRFGSDRRLIVADLRARIIALGGEPEDDGTLLAGAHRVFVRLKGMFGDGLDMVLDEVERGEDHLRSQYDLALTSPLSAETRRVVEIAYGAVRAGHDTFAAMKHACTG